jgi:short-subunit dehydrogenase
MFRSMSKREVALVTGASSGFGEVTARALVARGFHVHGTSRSGDAGPPSVEMHALDVDDDGSVERCIDALVDRTGRIDVLVNNAGRAMVGACEETTAAEARALFETNVFGVMRVTNRVLPIMRRRGAGAIVNVGSVSGFVGVPFHGAYAASKHALAGYTEALRSEVHPFGIRVSLVEPAAHRTGIRMCTPDRVLPLYDGARTTVESIIRAQIESGDAPERVAEVIVRAATDARPAFRYRVGGQAAFAAWARRWLPLWLFERVLRREFRLT